MRYIPLAALCLIFLLAGSCHIRIHHRQTVKKPVIYLYPQSGMRVRVKLETEMQLTRCEPAGNGSWDVWADPSGKLTDLRDREKYDYLFWEAEDDHAYILDSGFCVAGDSVKNFLRRQLPQMGLNEKETREFIAYWLPVLQQNKYNMIKFAGSEYSNRAKLQIAPQPDALLRVFMVFSASANRVQLPPQHFPAFTRKGFTVVEWGGTDITPATETIE